MGFSGRPNRFRYHVPRSGTPISLTSSPFFPASTLCPPKQGAGPNPQVSPSQPSSQKHYKGNPSSQSTSLLLKTFPGKKERQLFPPSLGPLSPQQIPISSPLQNGIGPFYSHGYSGVTLGLRHGLGRGLLPSPSRMAFPPLLRLRSGLPNLRFSIPPLRSVSCSMGLQQDHKPNKKPSPFAGYKSPLVPGRFPFHGILPRGPGKGNLLCNDPFQKSGSQRQSQKVTPFPFPVSGISRSNPSPRQPHSVPSRVKDSSHSQSLPPCSSAASQLSALSGELGGRPQLGRLFHSVGTSPPKTLGKVDEQTYIPSHKGSSSSSGPVVQKFPPSVVLPILLGTVSSNVSPCPLPPTNDRLVQRSLVRSPVPLSSRAGLASRVCPPTLKYSGVKSHPSSPSSLCSHPSKQPSDDHVGQHHSSPVHPPSGLLPVVSPHGVDVRHPHILLPAKHHADSQTHQRGVECLGRPGLTSSSSPKRMVPGSALLQVATSSGTQAQNSQSTSRLIRDSVQRPAHDLCVSSPRPSGSGSQCHVPGLEQMAVDLPISTSQSLVQDSSPSLVIQRQGNSGRSLPCKIRLVPNSSCSVSNSGSSPGLPLLVTNDKSRQGLPLLSTGFKPARVDTVIGGLSSLGYSKDAIDIALLAHGDSTTRQYQSVWNYFLEFLSKEKLSSSDIRPSTIDNFLTVHAKSFGRQYRTLSGYKSALRHPILLATGLDINTFESEFFRRGLFNFNPPQKAKEMPKWSVDDVLIFLKGSLFEPLHSVPLFRLRQKLLFLLLLATGRRIGDIANLSRRSFPHASYDSLCLRWVRYYKPKFRTPKWSPSTPSIGFLRHPSDGVLCPVRAYKCYLSRISPSLKAIPKSRRPSHLWVSDTFTSSLSKVDLTKAFISLIKDSRRFHDIHGNIPIGPHQCRKFGASLSVSLDHDKVRVLRRGATP